MKRKHGILSPLSSIFVEHKMEDIYVRGAAQQHHTIRQKTLAPNTTLATNDSAASQWPCDRAVAVFNGTLVAPGSVPVARGVAIGVDGS
jgi:hypothetical protein